MLAIAGGKGGSGKTTTALGLAQAYARRGRDPIVVDCDPDMPDLHHRAGIEFSSGIDRLATGRRIESVCESATTVPGVRLVTAGDRSNVDGALRELAHWHGPVLLDCPPGVGPDASKPLRHARRALIVSTDQPESVGDGKTTAQVARELDVEVVGALLRVMTTECRTRWTDDSPVLARVDTVETPLNHPQVRAVWGEIGAQIPVHRPVPPRS